MKGSSTIRLEDVDLELKRQLRIEAAKACMTMKDFIIEAIEEKLERLKSKCDE